MKSSERSGETIRLVLDYIIWISREMLATGYHSGSDRNYWGRRVQMAYAALFLPMLKGFGDPYPPDVPPARNPGIWPDVPSATIPGMTIRHQLAVIRMQADVFRSKIWTHVRLDEVTLWDKRLAATRDALDHGPELVLPEDDRTTPSAAGIAAAKRDRDALKAAARERALELRKQMRARKRAAATAARKAAIEAKAPPKPEPEPEPEPKKPAAAKKKKSTKRAAPKKKAAAKPKSTKRAAPKKKAAVKKKSTKRAAPKKAAAKKKSTKRAAPKKK